jgi:hypothetical protein
MARTDIERASDFVHRWRALSKQHRALIGKQMPVAAVQVAALRHSDAEMRRFCLFLLDHFASDGSSETFRQALRDPVAFVREGALHGISCERCRTGEVCVADLVTDLAGMLVSDPNAEVRHKIVVALARFLSRDSRVGEAIERAADNDPDPAVRHVARTVANSGQPHHRGRKAALRDARRARKVT